VSKQKLRTLYSEPDLVRMDSSFSKIQEEKMQDIIGLNIVSIMESFLVFFIKLPYKSLDNIVSILDID